jgi:hypothetical protein
MLSNEEFLQWCSRLSLSPEARQAVERVRSAGPTRRSAEERLAPGMDGGRQGSKRRQGGIDGGVRVSRRASGESAQLPRNSRKTHFNIVATLACPARVGMR